MSKKYYAVKQGRKPGIYQSWAECQEQVNGYGNAIFKGFSTLEEAEVFVNNCNSNVQVPRKDQGRICRELVAYVDGSYLDGAFSYGCVIFDEENIKEFKEAFYRHHDSSMRNVAGELKGARKAIQYALETDATSLDIYYDYQGIESWANKTWKANLVATKSYRDYVEKAREKLTINFHKVKGHSGDKWNERADKLAKEALGI